MAIRAIPDRVALTPGATAQLRCQAEDVDGQVVGGADFEFQSDDPRISTVDRFGRIAAVGPTGATHIIVRSGSLRARVPVRVDHGPPAELQSVSGDAQQVVAGAAAAQPWVVRLRDAAGNPVPGAALRLRFETRDDSLQATTDAGGEVAWNPEMPSIAGYARMVVEPVRQDPERPLDLKMSARILPDTVATLDGGAAGAAAPDPALSGWLGTVQARDRFGNPVPQAAIEWQVTPACGRVLDRAAMTTDSGTASITIERIRKLPRSCRVIARSGEAIATAVSLR